jgi:GNAT superfamily N-acetyltransferase
MLERICVHPAYWRKGHGKAMINWGIQLSEMDGVKLGVMTSRGGEDLYRSVGFKLLGEVSVERDIKQAGKSQAEDGIRFSLMEYTT